MPARPCLGCGEARTRRKAPPQIARDACVGPEVLGEALDGSHGGHDRPLSRSSRRSRLLRRRGSSWGSSESPGRSFSCSSFSIRGTTRHARIPTPIAGRASLERNGRCTRRRSRPERRPSEAPWLAATGQIPGDGSRRCPGGANTPNAVLDRVPTFHEPAVGSQRRNHRRSVARIASTVAGASGRASSLSAGAALRASRCGLLRCAAPPDQLFRGLG